MKTTFITETYYKETYLGLDTASTSGYNLKNKNFDYYSQFASDDVHSISIIDIKDENIYDNLATKYVEAIQRATAIMTEYYITNGTNTNRVSRSVELGSFKSSQGQTASDTRYETTYEKVKQVLANVGLYYYNYTEDILDYIETEWDWTKEESTELFVKAFNEANELDENSFEVNSNGKIGVKNIVVPDSSKFGDGTSVDTQATRAEDIVSVEDIAIREIAEANTESINLINQEQTIQNNNIATNAGNISTIVETISNQTTGEFVGSNTGGVINEGVWQTIIWQQSNNNFSNITYDNTNGVFTLTEEITNLNFFVRGQADNTAVSKNVSIRLWDTINNVVVGQIRTEAIQTTGIVEVNSIIPTISAGSYRVEITSTTGAGQITFTQGEIYVFKFGGGGTGIITSDQVVDTSLTEPTLGINPKLIKIGELETELTNKVDSITISSDGETSLTNQQGTISLSGNIMIQSRNFIRLIHENELPFFTEGYELEMINENGNLTTKEYVDNKVATLIRKLAIKLGLQEKDIEEILLEEEKQTK